MGAAQEEEEEGLPNSPSFQRDIALVALLKACAHLQDLNKASRLHADILKWGLLETNIFIGTSLFTVYARCGALTKAQLVFDKLPMRDVVSWTALITCYVQQGRSREALSCFERMQQHGLFPSSVTFACILKACSSSKAVDKGKYIHSVIIRKGLLEESSALGNALVDMYFKFGELAKARQVFDELPSQNVVSWTTLIAGYCQHGHGGESLACFEQMQCEGLSPDLVTLLCILQACTSLGAFERGRELHAHILREGLLQQDHKLGNALIDMYAKCGALSKAQDVFDELQVRTVVAWTALIAGYCQHGFGREALDCWKRMEDEGFHSNAVTCSCILKACGAINAVDEGKRIHCELVKDGLLGEDDLLETSLVDMYAKCGALVELQQVFDHLRVPDTVSWTALITGYCLHGHGKEALKCLHRMQGEGLSPDKVTWLCILPACHNIGASEMGNEVHSDIVKEGFSGDNHILGSALVDMYAKCGALAKAQDVFDNLLVRSVEAWTALFCGYAHYGKQEMVFELYRRMIEEGKKPNEVTFIVLCNACSRFGLVDEGQMYYKSMSTKYGMIPTSKHLACMVDLFSRAGEFDKAMEVIEKNSLYDYFPAWFSLLRACRMWGNVKLARLAFDNAVRLDENAAPAYACMSSIYAAAGMQDDADRIRASKDQLKSGLGFAKVSRNSRNHKILPGMNTYKEICQARLLSS